MFLIITIYAYSKRPQISEHASKSLFNSVSYFLSLFLALWKYIDSQVELKYRCHGPKNKYIIKFLKIYTKLKESQIF